MYIQNKTYKNLPYIKRAFIQEECTGSVGGTAPFLSTNHIARLVSFQFPLVLLLEGINFLSQSSMCQVDNVFPEDNIPLHLPEDSAFPRDKCALLSGQVVLLPQNLFYFIYRKINVRKKRFRKCLVERGTYPRYEKVTSLYKKNSWIYRANRNT